MRALAFLAAGAILAWVVAPAVAGDGVLGKLQDEVRELAARAGPAIVKVTAERKPPTPFIRLAEGEPELDLQKLLSRASSVSTGFLVDRSGLVLTTHRVSEDADRIRVDFPGGESREAELIGFSRYFQVGLVRVDPPEGVEPLELSPEEDVPVGSLGVFVGNSFGGSANLSLSIVSGSGKRIAPGEGAYENYLVLSSPVLPGDAGGPYLDPKGRVLGVAVGSSGGFYGFARAGGNGIEVRGMGGMAGGGLAIPAADLRFAIEQIREHGRVPASWMGVRVMRGTVEVGEVVEGSPAQAAGIRPGDVLKTFCGCPIATSGQLLFRLQRVAVGRPAPVTLLRGGEVLELECVLEDALVALEKALPGVRIDPAVGLRVASAVDDSPLQAGDFILAVNRMRVTSVTGALLAIRSGDGETIRVDVLREQRPVRVELPRE